METAKFNVIKTTDNKFYFTLVAHGLIIMVSENYYSKNAAYTAIEQVRTFSQTQTIDYIDNNLKYEEHGNDI